MIIIKNKLGNIEVRTCWKAFSKYLLAKYGSHKILLIFNEIWIDPVVQWANNARCDVTMEDTLRGEGIH